MAISDRIKFYRKNSNLTQSQLAELIGVSPQAISKWETGIGFSDYINAILRAGLKIQEIREPMPPELWKATAFGRYDNYIETPTYMIFKLSK